MDSSVEVLDTRDGLARVGGMDDLYLELLQRFVEELPQGLAALDALAPADRVRKVHSVRGVAGTVGAKALFEASTAFERALRVEPATAAHPAESARWVEALDATVATIAAHLESAGVPVAEAPADTPQAPVSGQGAVLQMRSMLGSGDPAAIELLASHTLAWRALLGAKFDAFAAAIDGFDFDAAANILGKE